MTPKVIVGPGDEPISIEEARAHLEAQPYFDTDVDTIDDTMIEGWLAAGREYCEDFLGLSLSTRTLEIALDAFPASRGCSGQVARDAVAVELPLGPVREVLDIYWGNDSDDRLSEDAFALDTYRTPNRVAPVAAPWPTVTAATNAIKIRYLAGYGVDSDGGEPLPKVIRAAILLVLGHLYENRSENTEAALASLPLGVEALLRPRRIRKGMA
jgi:uncharacterized phiE125 gp8 family phage protein